MTRFWISWYQPTEDYRPLTDPPAAAVCAWWCSGSRSIICNGDESDEAILCAIVKAASEVSANRAIRKSWPEVKEWRFCEACEPDWLPNNRFPITKAWERKRLGLK